MYADNDRVRSLIKNRSSVLPQADLDAAAALSDIEIDMRLSALFYWPTSSKGVDLSTDPPSMIVNLATLLTAAMIESQSYAANEATGLTANPYGKMLERRAMALLDKIEDGTVVIPGIERATQLAASKAPRLFHPVQGLRIPRGRGRR